jgi:hypothetical protein
VSLLKKAGSTVVEYFEWDLPKVLSQGGAGLSSALITEASLQSRMWSSLTGTLIAKVSSQNLARSSTTRIVSHYMTSFLVLHHERVRHHNGLSNQDDNHWWYHLASNSINHLQNASTLCMRKLNNSSAKEPIRTQYANKRATWMLGTIKSRSPVICQRQMQESQCWSSKKLLQQLINESPLDGI